MSLPRGRERPSPCRSNPSYPRRPVRGPERNAKTARALPLCLSPWAHWTQFATTRKAP